MATGWNIKKIESSSKLTATEKRILLDELYQKKNSVNVFSTLDILNYESFCREYKQMDEFLRNIGEKTYNYTENFYDKCLRVTNKYNPRIPDLIIDEKFLFSHMTNLILSLNEPDILKCYNEILSRKDLTNIKRRTDNNEAIKDFAGRCVYNESSRDTYISIYLTGEFRDLILLAHEIGHAIEHKLFFGESHPITKYYLTETTSYLFELLMANYIANYLGSPIVSKALISNRANDIMDYAWSIRIQRLFYDLGEYSPDKVAREMKKTGRMVKRENLTIDNIARVNKVYYSKLINSYLLALQIFHKILDNPREGFELYRKIETDPEEILDNLLQKYEIDYTKDENVYASVYNVSKDLSLSLTKRV